MKTKRVREGLAKAEQIVTDAKIATKAKLNLFDPIEILPFKGYGTDEVMIVIGRVLEESGVAELDRDASVWRNAVNTIKRIDSDEIPNALLELSFRDETWDERTDDDGYFRIRMKPDVGVGPDWHEVDLELIESVAGSGARATCRVMVPSPDAEFMVISDIDDTVIETGAMEMLHMARTVMTENAKQRSTFPGVVALYRALLAGPDEKGRNPMFYLSRSGWPLFDLFQKVFENHDLPEGPLLLRDLRLIEKKSSKLGRNAQKLDYIRELMELYDFPVVLIGDSGQHDPEIYREIIEDDADRVAAVYVRHVVGAERARQIERLYTEHLDRLCLAPSTMEMARHARLNDLISDDQLEAVRDGLEEDLEKLD